MEILKSLITVGRINFDENKISHVIFTSFRDAINNIKYYAYYEDSIVNKIVYFK